MLLINQKINQISGLCRFQKGNVFHKAKQKAFPTQHVLQEVLSRWQCWSFFVFWFGSGGGGVLFCKTA